MTERWGIDYVELHCHSAYSLRDGASTPAELVNRAADLGMDTLALTDHNAVYGAIPFITAAQARGIRPILGAELTLETGQHLTLLVRKASGWRSLCTLISLAQAQAPKGQAALPLTALDTYTDGLICLTGCRQGPLASALRRMDTTAAVQAARWLSERFGATHTVVELNHHLLPGDTRLVEGLLGLASHLGLMAVVTNNVHYARRDQQPLHDVLTAVRHQTTLAAAGSRLRGNSEYYLKTGGRLRPLFPMAPDTLTNTRLIANQCDFTLQYGLQDLPAFPTAPGCDAPSMLARLCFQILPQRYPGTPARVQTQLAYELRIIDEAGLSNYLLIVWDIVRYARQQGIRCQGRGSAANSLVAYLLGISPIDPIAHNLVFERFLSEERPAMPDIDLDIQADRHDEVIQYVFGRYGVAHAAMACTFSTFGARSAIRDLARVFDLPVTELLAAETTEPLNRTQTMAHELCRQLDGLPRHLGQHNGGMVLTAAPLAERVPIEPAAMPGRWVVQWDKTQLEDAGLVKIDLLGLRMLSALSESERLLAEVGTSICLDCLTFDDPAVYAMISEADTIGVFQLESRAQAQMLPRLRPTCMDDLIVAISLIRPGPIQGEMVHPYLRRRTNQEPVSYLHPALEPALGETLGVILYQEQVLKVARDLAGFTPGQGEHLRRALGSGKGAAAIEPFRDAFVQGAMQRRVSRHTAETVFQQLEAFGGYSFPKSHAAAFAVIVYQSAWLKCYHPAAFLTALLNNQPMGFWTPAVLVRDARRHGLTVLPLDLAQSASICSLASGQVRLGFSYVRGLGDEGIERLLAARNHRPFRDLADLCRRTHLPRHLIEALILAGACDVWEVERRQLLWQLGTLRYEVEELDLPLPDEEVTLPALTPDEAQALQMGLLGVSTSDHPLAHWRAALQKRGYLGSQELAACRPGQSVHVVGTVVVHQAPPSAKYFHFLTLEDEAGLINVIVRPYLTATVPKRKTGYLLRVEGSIQHEGGVTNVLARRLEVVPR